LGSRRAGTTSAKLAGDGREAVANADVHIEVPFKETGQAPATINLRLAAVRRVAYEAADAGLLNPELAAGIRRVKEVRRIGVRLGNRLTTFRLGATADR
jgi:hypothetical protein